MPRKVYKKKVYRKKRYSKRPAKGLNSLAYQGPLRRQLKTTMTYCDQYTLQPTSAPVTSHQMFSLNGLHDPDITGFGHQPRGFDQLMTLYDHYVVIGVQVEALVTNLTTATAAVVATIRDNNVPDTNFISQMENPNRKTIMLAGSDAGGSAKSIKFNFNPNKFLGRSHPLSDPDVKGTATANPLEGCFLQIGHLSDNGNTRNPISLTITMKYLCVLIEPKQVGES